MSWTAHIYGVTDITGGDTPALLQAGVSLIELRGLVREVTKTVTVVVYDTNVAATHNADDPGVFAAALDACPRAGDSYVWGTMEDDTYGLNDLFLEERRPRIINTGTYNVSTSQYVAVYVEVELVFRRQSTVPELMESGGAIGSVMSSGDVNGQTISVTVPGFAIPQFHSVPLTLARPWLIFEWCDATNTPETVLTKWAGKVNAATFRGSPPKTWKCVDLQIAPVNSSGTTKRWRFRARLEWQNYKRSLFTASRADGAAQDVGWREYIVYTIDGFIPNDAGADSSKLIDVCLTENFSFFAPTP